LATDYSRGSNNNNNNRKDFKEMKETKDSFKPKYNFNNKIIMPEAKQKSDKVISLKRFLN